MSHGRDQDDSNDTSSGDHDKGSQSPSRAERLLVIEANGRTYECLARTGKGSFGVVYKARERGSQEVVAIKRVLQDPRYKNRELQIMKMIKHPNAVQLLNSFYERSKGEVFLNLVLGYMPKNLYEVCTSYAKRGDRMPIEHVRIYIYQLLRALAYVHSLGVCHRDIKPQNLLIDPDTRELKLCDFGSAKILVRGEPNVSYICSRYYRAPELIFGAGDYTPAIDVWSSGCVMAEMLLGEPLFAGESGVDQLVEIIKVLGTPSYEEIHNMNPNYDDYNQFPAIKPHPWAKVLPPLTPAPAVDLLASLLIYTPTQRLLPLDACAHHFFDLLRANPRAHTPLALPLFDWTPEEAALARDRGLLDALRPREGEVVDGTSS